MKSIGFLILIAIIVAVVMAVRASQAEGREGKTLASLPPSVQHVVAQMDAATQTAFFNEYWDKRRKLSIAYILWILLGVHYLYVKKVGIQVAFWLLWFVGIGEVWWIVDLFRMPSIARDANEQIARQALQTLQIATNYAPLQVSTYTTPVMRTPDPAKAVGSVNFCSVCGNPASSSEQFCKSCGAKLPQDAQNAPSPEPTDNTPPESLASNVVPSPPSSEEKQSASTQDTRLEPSASSNSEEWHGSSPGEDDTANEVVKWCDACGKDLEANDKFCRACGAPAQEVKLNECLECGGRIELEDVFCRTCGASLA